MLNIAYDIGVQAALRDASLEKSAWWAFPVAGAMTQVAYDALLNPEGARQGYVNSALRGAITAGGASLGKGLAHKTPLTGALAGGLAGYYLSDKLTPGQF